AAGVRGRDADDGADADRDGAVRIAGPADRDKEQTRQDQRGNGHARDRVRRGADETGDPRRHGDEEKPENDDEDGRQEIPLSRHPWREREKEREQERSAEYEDRRNVALGPQLRAGAGSGSKVLQAF